MTQAPAPPVVRRQVVPVYAAGFVTAFGAHAVAANLGRYALGHHGSLWELGLLLGIYDGAEVVLKPVFGALADALLACAARAAPRNHASPSHPPIGTA